MLVDTHAHLYLSQFDADREAVLQRARASGVETILLPAVDLASVHAALDLAVAHDGVHAMAGIHPSYVSDMSPGDLDEIETLASDPRIVALGETGLDYYWTREHIEAQHHSLREHARIAMATGKPLVLHNRDTKGSDACSQDLLRILREAIDAYDGTLRGVFHCFSGPAWLAPEILDLGFHIGLGGTLTFKNGGVPDAITGVPLDRIVLETDAPYLAPAPHRGTRNEPAHTRQVAERLAELRSMTPEAIAEITTATARDLFGLSDG